MKKRNYARNFQEGIFKLCELNMDISASEHVFIPSEAQWFSADQNTAKQRFIFTVDGETTPLHTVQFMRIVYEFPEHDSEWQMIDWPVSDPVNGIIETIIPDQILTVGTTEMVQHIYLIQPIGYNSSPDEGDSPDGEEWGMIKPYAPFDTADGWVDVGVVLSNVNKSFVDRNMEPMRDFYVLRFEEVKREIYDIRDRVLELLQDIDPHAIIAQGIQDWLQTNQMPTTEWVNQIHTTILTHSADNIRHLNANDRFNLHTSTEHVSDEDVHLSEIDRQSVNNAGFHINDEHVHISPQERQMIIEIYDREHGGDDEVLNISDIHGLEELLELRESRIIQLEEQVATLSQLITQPTK